MAIYTVYNAAVRAADTGELRTDLVGQQVQVVTRGTTTPFPIQTSTGDPISGSLLTVQTSFCVPTFYIDASAPADLYLDWLDPASGERGGLDFDGVLRDEARAARIAAEASATAAFASQLAAEAAAGGGGGVTRHGDLSGLDNDDHPQYFNQARGDQRYYTKEQSGTLVANSVGAASIEDRKRSNHTGEQPISSITNLESRLAALEAGGGGGSGILLIPEGTEPPLGTPPGLIGYMPSGVDPVTLVESVSYDSESTTVSCPVPTGAAVGDVVIFIPATSGDNAGAGNWTCSDTGWEEILDYSANQSRKTAAFVYRIPDATALSNLGTAVTGTQTVTGRRCGVCFVLSGSLASGAWPTYSSGSNRSAATLNSVTTGGWTIQGFSTVTVPFHKVVAVAVHDAAAAPSLADGFTQVGWATGSAGGSVPITLTVLQKDLAAAPVPAAVVTHPTADSTAAGGGQFIVPVA